MNSFKKFLNLIRIRNHRRFRLSIRSLALFMGLLVGFFVSVQVEEGNYYLAFFLFFIVLATAIFELVLGDLLADKSFPFDTERKMELMEKRVGITVINEMSENLKQTIAKFVACDQAKVSATVHVIAEVSSKSDGSQRYGLLQLTNYVGPQGGKKGRMTQINQGIIGRCARTEKVETVDFADSSEYQVSMVRDFGFTREEARRHTATARSYLAYPLKDDERLIGVLYFFTEEPQVFPKGADLEQLNAIAQRCVKHLKIVNLA